MNETELEILNGCLLGDGSIVLAKHAKNAYFAYTSSQKDHIDFVCKNFMKYATNRYQNGPIKSNIYDKRTNKNYTTYQFKTKSLIQFTDLYNKWYINNVKFVTKDLKLTNITNLYWYIGDGSLLREFKSGYSSDIKLATYCFSENDVRFLIELLCKYNPVLCFNEKNQPYIKIRKRDTKNFLNDIGNEYPLCYKHKWNYTEYKNKQPTFTSLEVFQEIQNKYLLGQTVYYLSKEYNVSIGSIKNFLKKQHLYKPLERKNYGKSIKIITNNLSENLYEDS